MSLSSYAPAAATIRTWITPGSRRGCSGLPGPYSLAVGVAAYEVHLALSEQHLWGNSPGTLTDAG